MIWSSISLALCPLALPPTPVGPGDPGLLAIKVGKAETATHGTLEHAVILIENGKIVTIGEDLPIERGIPVLDKDPEWTVMPGLVDAYSRIGMDSEGGNDSTPQSLASAELYPGSKDYKKVLEAGVTTLGLYPPGNGIPGQAVAVRTKGETREDMILDDGVYLKVILRASSTSKKMLRDGFEQADKYIEKEKKEREKYDKEKEKADKKKKPKKDDEKKDDEKKSDDKKPDEKKPDDKKDEKSDGEPEKELGPYVPPTPDPIAKAFLDLRSGALTALISINDSADYLHTLDAIGKETFHWDLRIPVQRESNIFYVASEIGAKGCRVVMEPELSLQPNTMRQRNLPAELQRAGAKLVLVPRSDDVHSHEEWLRDTGILVGSGLPREAAIQAMTIEPANVLGLQDRLGSLDAGKDANLIFLNGDPFEPTTQLEAVMLEGRFVSGEVNL